MLLHFGADTGLSGACWPKWWRESLSPWKINPPRKYFCFRFGWWSSNFSWNKSKYIKIYLAITCHHDFSFLRLNFSSSSFSWSAEGANPQQLLVLTSRIYFNDNNNNIGCRTILVEPTMLPVKCFLQSQTFPSVHSAYMTKEPLLESFVSCEWWMIIFLLSMFIASSLAENLLPCLHSSPSSRLGAAMSSGKISSVLMRLMSF